jgi:5-formyltetrahydrofolate cyclo-ligase
MVHATMSEQELALRVAVKKEQRKRMRGVRNTLPRAVVEQRSARVAARIASLEVWARARSVAFFWPIEGRNEVDLRDLLRAALAAGKRVALPATAETPEGVEIELRWVDDPSQLEPGPLGFEEPPPAARRVATEDLDLILVPALAVDPRGHRVGYGRGFYDRLLARLGAAEKGPVSLAVAFDFQLLPEVSITPGDVAVTLVVTDERLIEAAVGVSEAPLAVSDGRPPEAGVKVIARPAPRGV